MTLSLINVILVIAKINQKVYYIVQDKKMVICVNLFFFFFLNPIMSWVSLTSTVTKGPQCEHNTRVKISCPRYLEAKSP